MPLLCPNTISCSSPPANITLPKLGKGSKKKTPVLLTGNANFHKVASTSGEDKITKALLASNSKLGNTKKAGQILMKPNVADDAKECKKPKAKPKSEVSRFNSLILFNVPVSKDSLLEQRALFDQEQWSNLCNKLGLNISSAKLCRHASG
ncbi:unnamed protein product [Trichobilharzia regenti]|nr:unnamed protein product [Trichobilharzia regenti]